MYTIEVATTDFPTTASAVAGGANRIELCSAISEGGITPSHGLIRQCIQQFTVPVFPIIRPRSGDFLYSDQEYQIILDDIRQCRQLGCTGVVTGFLLQNGDVDVARTKGAVEEADGMEVTFHRAFDRCKNPFHALEQLIEIGCSRVLTSGQQLTAIEGVELIKQLVVAASGRIIVMPGSGVAASNIGKLQQLTGATEFHTALRSATTSRMDYVNPVFYDTGDYSIAAIRQQEISMMKHELLT